MTFDLLPTFGTLGCTFFKGVQYRGRAEKEPRISIPVPAVPVSELLAGKSQRICNSLNWFKGVTFTFWIKIDRKNIFPKINSKIYLFSGSFPARSSDTGTAGTGIEILGSLSARPLVGWVSEYLKNGKSLHHRIKLCKYQKALNTNGKSCEMNTLEAEKFPKFVPKAAWRSWSWRGIEQLLHLYRNFRTQWLRKDLV